MILKSNDQDNRFFSRKITFDEPVVRVEGLETKFDVIPVSNSLALVIGDRDEAAIVQQLCYWTYKGYGEVIDGVRWFYKPIREWIEEVFPTFSKWKLDKLLKRLADRGIIVRKKLFTKHQIQNGDRFWWQPKNQTYYYSLNTDKLQELADNFQTEKTPGKPETSVCLKTRKLSNWEIKHTKDSDCPENITENTSTEDKQRKNPPPTPSETKKSGRGKETVVSFEKNLQNEDLWDESPKQNKSSSIAESFPKKSKPRRVVHYREKIRHGNNTIHSAPWSSPEEYQAFYDALVKALPIVANARSSDGMARKIVNDLRNGHPHSYWNDFAAGVAIGTSTKPEWEAEPGTPYPMFVNYLAQKCKQPNDSDEKALFAAWDVLSYPKKVKSFWAQFKRSVANVAERADRDRALGVTNPNTPIWTRERIEPSIEEAASAAEEIKEINREATAIVSQARLASLPAPNVNAKNLPVSNSKNPKESYRANTKKNHIDQMSVAEINDRLADPILRNEIAGQLIQSDRFDVERDYLGNPISVTLVKGE